MATGNAGQQAQTGKNKATLTDKLQLFFDAVLTVAACIGIIFGLRQLYAISEQIDIAKNANEVAARAAKATEDSNDIARRTGEMQLRAWLGIDSSTIAFDPDTSTTTVTQMVKNYGQTPAYEVSGVVEIERKPVGAGAKPVKIVVLSNDEPVTYSGPGHSQTEIQKFEMTADDMDQLRAGKLEFIIYTFLDYYDAFDADRLVFSELRWVGIKGESRLLVVEESDESGFDADFLAEYHRWRAESILAQIDAKQQRDKEAATPETPVTKEPPAIKQQRAAPLPIKTVPSGGGRKRWRRR